MSKDKKRVNKKELVVASRAKVDNLPEDELRVWAEFFGVDEYPDNADEVLTELDTRVANLGDLTAIMTYLDKVSKEELMYTLKMMTERMTILEYIVTDKLNVSIEEMKEYAEKYNKEMEEVKEEMEKLMKENEGEGNEGGPSLELVEDNEEG